MTTERAGSGSGTGSGRASRRERKKQERKRLFMWLGGGLALVAVVAGAVWWFRRPEDPMVAMKRHLDRGDMYAQQGQMPEAIVEYRGAVQALPISTLARTKLADAYMKMNNLREAYGHFIRIADLNPEDNKAQIKAGEMLLMAGKFEDARTRAEIVLARDPKNAEATVIRANALAGVKDLAGAVKDLEDAILFDPARTDTYTNLGVVQLARGNRVEAEAAFKKAVEADPKSVVSRLALGNFYFATGRPKEAEAELKAALQTEPENLLANRALAVFAIASGRATDAEPYLQTIARVAKTPGARLSLADYYVALRRNDDATKILTELASASSEPGTFVTAKIRLAALEQTQGQTARAHKYVDEALERDATSAPALTMRGRLFLTERKRDQAVAALTEAVKADTGDAGAHFALGQAYLSLNNWDLAAREFQEVLKLNPRALVAELFLARVSLGRLDAAGTVQHADQVLLAQPGSPEARSILIRGLLLSGDVSRAERELKPLLDNYPKAPTSYALQGAIALAKKDAAGARRAFEKARTLGPNDVEALTGLVGMHVSGGNAKEALALVEKALGDNPNSVPIQLLAARLFMATGALDRAEQALRKAIDLDSATIQAYSMLGALFVRQSRLNEARAEFEKIAKQQPQSIGAQTLIGMIYELQQKRSDAEQAYQKAIDIDRKGAAVASNNLAWIYVDTDRNLDQALDLALEAQRQLPDEPNVNDTLGWIYYKKERYTEAIRALTVSVTKDPKKYDSHYHLGVVYAKFGEPDKAKAHFKEVLTLQPNSPEAGEARKALAAIGG